MCQTVFGKVFQLSVVMPYVKKMEFYKKCEKIYEKCEKYMCITIDDTYTENVLNLCLDQYLSKTLKTVIDMHWVDFF